MKKIRILLNLTQQAFGEKLGGKDKPIDKATISKYEKGQLVLSSKSKVELYTTLGVNKDYLENGIEPMFIENASAFNDILRNLKPERHQGRALKQYLLENGFKLDFVASVLSISNEKLEEIFESKEIDESAKTLMFKNLHLPYEVMRWIENPDSVLGYRNRIDAQHWGYAIRNWFARHEYPIEVLYDVLKDKFNRASIDRYLNMKVLPDEFVRELLKYFQEIATGPEAMVGFPVPKDFEFDIVPNFSVISYTERNHMLVKCVQKKYQHNYTRKLINSIDADFNLIKLFDDVLVRIPNDYYEDDKYFCFEMNGDNMNDGSQRSLLDADRLLGLEIPINDFEKAAQDDNAIFILVTANGPSFSQVKFNPEHPEIVTCQSFNPRFKNYDLPLSNINQVFIVKRIVERMLIVDNFPHYLMS